MTGKLHEGTHVPGNDLAQELKDEYLERLFVLVAMAESSRLDHFVEAAKDKAH